MVLDAVLAYFHFIAIFILFAFLTVQAVIIRRELDAGTVRLLGRMDLWYFGASMAVLFSGLLRLGAGAKGADFYLSSWPIYVKLGLFVVVGIMSVWPTKAFIRWRRALEHDAAWQVPAEEHRRVRKLVMSEVHLAALIPVFAVIMARGLGR
jgi:putative membrane protein